MLYDEAIELVKTAIFTDRQPCSDCVRRAIMCLEGRQGTGMTTDDAITEVRERVREIRTTAHEHSVFMHAMEAIQIEMILRKAEAG